VSRVQWNEHSPSQVLGSVHRVKHFCRPCCLKEDSNADCAICICDWDYFDHRLCAIRLKGWAGRTLAVIVVLSVSYFGPQVFGKDWFQEGYIAGIVLGGFAWEAFEDRLRFPLPPRAIGLSTSPIPVGRVRQLMTKGSATTSTKTAQGETHLAPRYK
jgi:hypothetical protein